MTPLSRGSFPSRLRLGEAAPETTGMVHLGLGNFHRAHTAVYTAKALAVEPGNWGIYGFANRSRRVVNPMARQDGLYSVLEYAGDQRRAGVVDVHRRSGVLMEDPGALVKAIADPAHKIFTLTVSEHGYCRSPRTGKLDVERDDVRADLADPTQLRSTIGIITQGLVRRAVSGEPITVLSCDNLQDSGTTTRNVITEFLEASNASPDVLDYLKSQVTFPNGMVDRIVPDSSSEINQAASELLGVRDEAAVPAEEFSMWVLEDRFAAGRPAWEHAGVTFSDEVAAYELVKLRLLNGSHSLMAYLGALAGKKTIPEAWGQDFIREAVNALIREEYLPTITLPPELDLEAYLADLSSRWANTGLGDLTSRVGSNGSVKLLQRVPEAAEELMDTGRAPHVLALIVAAWVCAVAPPGGFTLGPVCEAMVEPHREKLREVTRGASSPARHVAAIFEAGFLPDSLAARTGFVERVGELAEIIVLSGPAAAAKEAVSASGTAGASATKGAAK